uniref:BMC domain-containing protein n=1 Tax=Endozoicomonas sp. Mp262 TaxID=2919499 RepID=UPI00351B893B
MNRQQATGFIETFGYLPAVEAADVCLKTAHVSLVGIKNVGAGLVTIIIRGDVGAAKAAIEAGTLAADKVGTVVSSHVIARPVDELDSMLADIAPKHAETVPADISKSSDDTVSAPTLEELQGYRAVELRNMARQLQGFDMSKQQIKFARKKELIQAIIAYYERVKTIGTSR